MNLEKLCNHIIKLTKSVGNFIKAETISLADIETKSKNSLVTYVDKQAEKQIVDGLMPLIEGAGFITEEETNNSLGDNYYWIIDPLDGTTNFIHGIPFYSISIALQHNNNTVLGVVLEVTSDECFYAWEGGGAFLNGKPIQVSTTPVLAESLLATGFPYYDYNRLDDYLELLKYFMQETRGIRRMGSAALDLAYVACGRFDGFYEYSLNPWDVAAGAFIVKQAGGKVTDFKGGTDYLFGKSIVAGNNLLFSDFSDAVKEFMSR